MIKVIRWIKENALISIALVTLSGTAATVYQMQEIGANDYEMVSHLYSNGSPQVKQLIRESFVDGQITTWNCVTISRQALAKGGTLVIRGGEGNIATERAKLRHLINQDTGHE